MDHGRRSNRSSATLGHRPDRAHTTIAAVLDDDAKPSGATRLRLIPFYLVVLLGFAAIGLAPPETKPPVTPVQVAQPNGVPMEPAAAERKQVLEEERSWVDALRRGLTAARMEREAARAQALASQVQAKQEHDLAEREPAANEQSFLIRHKDIDEFKTSSAHEENLPRELAAAGQEPDATQRVVGNASTLPGAVADPIDKQRPALEGQRQKAEGLAHDLALTRLNAENVAARNTAEASLAETRRALEAERRKVRLLERDIAEARRFIEAQEASAKLAATMQAGAIQGRQLAEAAARQAGEALAQERERTSSLARDLETARRERDAAKEEFTRISMAFKEAWEQEHKKAIDLASDLASAGKDIGALKHRAERRTAHIEDAAKAHPTDRAVAHSSRRRSSTNLGRQEVGNAEVRNSRVVRLMAITLPDALLPTRPPAEGSSQ